LRYAQLSRGTGETSLSGNFYECLKVIEIGKGHSLAWLIGACRFYGLMAAMCSPIFSIGKAKGTGPWIFFA
jgi:hypothetical protein